MLVLSSPSGAGKTTISRALLERDANLSLSVSATTRPMRPNELEGVHYFFKDQAEFERMVKDGEFLEHARVFGHVYGTPKAPVEAALAEGKDVLFDIDWQGTQQVAEAMPKDLVRVFILPPSHDELERRLYTRAQDSRQVVEGRMAKAASEMSHWQEYDYVVINRELDRCIAEVEAILQAERLKRERQTNLSDFIRDLAPES
ncbi:MAG: guanylate kinase [Rhodovibrionaceae bacterium]